jgi:hypothetical protein
MQADDNYSIQLVGSRLIAMIVFGRKSDFAKSLYFGSSGKRIHSLDSADLICDDPPQTFDYMCTFEEEVMMQFASDLAAAYRVSSGDMCGQRD